MDLRAYAGKRVLVTGHTGFKGAWLTLWLEALGADVHGIALAPDTRPALFTDIELHRHCHHAEVDIRDAGALARAIDRIQPDLVFHLAAQSLVRKSYQSPVETLATNVMGTAHLLDALRAQKRRCSVVVVTSDKCYENDNSGRAFVETDRLGGHDPYSMSKAAAELVTATYRSCFFHPSRLDDHQVTIASARAGNVIGGGDWSLDRLVPDAIKALAAGAPIPVRNPTFTRPWQHVLEPLAGYLEIGMRLAMSDEASAERWSGPWNLGPAVGDVHAVRDLVTTLIEHWGEGSWKLHEEAHAPVEARALGLATAKALENLDWRPRWGFRTTVEKTATWYKAHAAGARGDALRRLCLQQIDEYTTAKAG